MNGDKKAIFLDRDGVLIRERGDYNYKTEDIELVPGIATALQKLAKQGFIFIVITNQGGIGKGLYRHRRVKEIHADLKDFFSGFGVNILEFYYCPHHPEKGFPGERPELKINCDCRKPKTGMVQRAVAELNIDLAQSWFVGDTTTDVQTAKNAGIKSILLRTGYGGTDAKHAATPDFQADDLLAAVNQILGGTTP